LARTRAAQAAASALESSSTPTLFGRNGAGFD
jgi:hypothetical protein